MTSAFRMTPGAFRTALGRYSGPFYGMSLLLIMAFLIGGGSRGDIASLMLLRPVAALLLGYGLWRLRAAQIREHRLLFALAVSAVLLVAGQLVPLPPSLWSALPGRDLIVDIDRVAGLGAVWRPLSMVPSGAWNALYALLLPLAALVLAVQLDARERRRLVPLLLGLGLTSAIVAIVQLTGTPDGPFYFYRVTNNGAAVGLFANRNHQAAFLASMLPLLAIYASDDFPSHIDPRFRSIAALAYGIMLMPLVLVTGSRAGLLLALIGLASTVWLYRLPRSLVKTERARLWWRRGGLAAAALIAAVAGLTIWLGRAQAFDRFLTQSMTEEERYRAWGTVVDIGLRHFPVGTGFGSFVEIFQVYEPYELLKPTRFNHAHNDWLELFVTGGAPAVILLCVAIGGVIMAIPGIVKAHGERREGAALAAAGSSMLVLFAVASITDYPLRVPSLAVLTTLTVVWMSGISSHRVGAKRV